MIDELLKAHIRITDQLELSKRQLSLCEQDIAFASCPFKVGQIVHNQSTGLSSYTEGLVEYVIFNPKSPHWSVEVALMEADGAITPYKATWSGEFIKKIRGAK